MKIRPDARRISSQHNHAVGQQHGFLDIMGHDENGFGVDLLCLPQLQQFAAKVLGGQHVERGERFVHEQDFRLHDQSAGKSHTLFHTAGKFLGISRLKTFQSHGIDGLQRGAMTIRRIYAAGQ